MAASARVKNYCTTARLGIQLAMSSASLGAARLVARRTVATVVGTSAAFAASLTLYSKTDGGLGFGREVKFWHDVGPVVFDYWWNLHDSSPKVRLGAVRSSSSEGGTEGGDEGAAVGTRVESREKVDIANELHDRNAPKIFHSMVSLGGMYIKLGQVLSVTAIPVPEQYRVLFRTLQSDVPNSCDYESVIRPTLERELGVASLDEIFERIDEAPCGAASIGQAHRAVLKSTGEEVIVKVQYPDAGWKIPADVRCVGDFLSVCVFFGVVDEESSKSSYDEFARQFLSELDYERERENLTSVHRSSLDPSAPYLRRGVVVPRAHDELCTGRVVTMTYLPGPKFEEEARRGLATLGVDPGVGMRAVVMKTREGMTGNDEWNNRPSSHPRKRALLRRLVSVDAVLSIVRFARRIVLWSTVVAVSCVRAAPSLLVPDDWREWADERESAAVKAERWGWTREAVSALFDVHGYQILNQGLFNADPHPGNILIVQDEKDLSKRPKIGLIDYGQVKRIDTHERLRVAKLILSIANKEPDDVVADHFRNMGIKTRTDSTRFLAEFGRLMFGHFETKHLDHDWHRELHREDRVLYFPNELSMVYRTALLLRGLAMSLQFNPSVGEEWRHHAQETIKFYEAEPH